MMTAVKKANVVVRKVDVTDLVHKEEAYRVVNLAYRSEGGWTHEKHIVSGERCTLEDMDAFIRKNGQPNTTLFAYEDNTVVGTVQIQPSEEHPSEAEIGLLSVNPSHQSRGIGVTLVRSALDEMKRLGFSYAMMHVLENRPEIIQWYKKLGFSETGERLPFVWTDKLLIDNVHFVTLKKPLE